MKAFVFLTIKVLILELSSYFPTLIFVIPDIFIFSFYCFNSTF
jgi:hypothetical protein